MSLSDTERWVDTNSGPGYTRPSPQPGTPRDSAAELRSHADALEAHAARLRWIADELDQGEAG